MLPAGLLEAEAETEGRDSHRVELGNARPYWGATTHWRFSPVSQASEYIMWVYQ